VGASAERPASIAQFTGLARAISRTHEGLRSLGMNAVERKVSGRTTKLTAPISVSSFRARRAMPMDSDPIAHASSAEQPISTTTPRAPPDRLAPRAAPRPTMISDWTTTMTLTWPSGPATSATGRTGETRNRSMIPLWRSLITPIPLQPAEKRAVMTTIPGSRKST
jgi:hypothetical protein